MHRIKALFFNRDERRVRLLWRLIVLFVLVSAATYGAAGLLLEVVGNPVASIGGAAIGVTMSVWLTGRRLDRRQFAGFGFHLGRDWWIDGAFGFGLGLVLMSGIFAAEYAGGWVVVTGTAAAGASGLSFGPALAVAFAVMACVGYYEELLVRGYLLQNFAEGFRSRWLGPRQAVVGGWLLSSVLFGLGHVANPNASVVSTVNIIVAGLFIGLAYVLTRELALPIGLHLSWNFAQGNLYGFPVSGAAPPVSVLVIEQRGPDVWTGGAFGPEAGLVGLVAMLAGTAAIWAWVRFRYGPPALRAELAAPPAGKGDAFPPRAPLVLVRRDPLDPG